jgi:hypothetical protein
MCCLMTRKRAALGSSSSCDKFTSTTSKVHIQQQPLTSISINSLSTCKQE